MKIGELDLALRGPNVKTELGARLSPLVTLCDAYTKTYQVYDTREFKIKIGAGDKIGNICLS